MAMCAAFNLIAVMLLGAPADEGNAPVSFDSTQLSYAFWNDWQTLKKSDKWQALKQSVGVADQARAAALSGAEKGTQAVVNVGLSKPADVAKVLNGSAHTATDVGAGAALGTALSMRASRQEIAAAQPLVAPEARRESRSMTANLTTGIAGLPGIYLGPQDHPRPSAPEGYAPVSGGSAGCPGR